MQNKYGPQGLVVLAVNAWDEPKIAVQKFVDEQKTSYRVLLDGGGVAKKYGIVGLPTTFWVHKDGSVVRQMTGGNVSTCLVGARAASC
jgi:hypothetical protein